MLRVAPVLVLRFFAVVVREPLEVLRIIAVERERVVVRLPVEVLREPVEVLREPAEVERLRDGRVLRVP